MPDLNELRAFQDEVYPQSPLQIEAVGPMSATLSYSVSDADLRPGGTVSGPTMFALADNALYIAILGEIGLLELTVTTSMTINFLRKPAAGRSLSAECRIIKLGKVLAVGEIYVYSEGTAEPVAHVTGTYSIPPR